MGDKITKSPHIRFAGFTDDWEQRKLCDETNSIDTGKSKFKAKENGIYEILGSTSVIGYDDSYDYEGDFLLTARVGANAGELYRHSGKVKISDNTVFIQGGNLDFTFYKLLNFDIKRLSFGTGQPLVKASELKQLELLSPTSNEEKAQIGYFFAKLDNIITLHQRKLELLKVTKKSMLQKMFPKDGETVPEIRFAGFTDAWEERKLGELLKEFSVKSKIEDEHTVLSSTNSGMEVRDGRVSGTSNLGYKIIEDGDLVLSPQNLWLGNININNIGIGLVSPSYKTFKFEKVNIDFIGPQLRTARMLEEYKNASTQGASVVRRNLELDSFYQIPVRVPSNEEQEKVGEFFTNLDQLITLHKRELDLLKDLKKSMLQQMFI